LTVSDKNSFRLFLLMIISALIFNSCERKSMEYQAEKDLFRARKMRHELSYTSLKGEFLTRTLDTYREIVQRYGDRAGSSAALDTIVVTAQLEMAQLEFRTGMLDQAYHDFRDAFTIAEGIPSARANAIFSAAVIARELNDAESSIDHYRQFYREFLAPEARPFKIELNRRYIVAPIETGHLYLDQGNRKMAYKWYSAAEELYSAIIESGSNPNLVNDARLNRITALLQKEQWEKAAGYLDQLESEVTVEDKLPALMYIRARIQLKGFNNRSGAVAILEEIARKHPESGEASSALVTAAGIKFREAEYDETRNLCQRILADYPQRRNEAAEAIWMLAEIEEKGGNWLEASLHYKSLYQNYPFTLQGLEAPLKIASHFKEAGEEDVARDTYQRARDHYRELISESNSQGARIMAEKYLVRALTEDDRWEEAVTRLLELIDSYPGYRNFRGNYLRAASICEEKMNDPDRAAKILMECIERYPGTNLAGEARKQLNRIRSSK